MERWQNKKRTRLAQRSHLVLLDKTCEKYTCLAGFFFQEDRIAILMVSITGNDKRYIMMRQAAVSINQQVKTFLFYKPADREYEFLSREPQMVRI